MATINDTDLERASINDLRELENYLIDLILQHYDNIENVSAGIYYEDNITCFERAIKRDMFKLSAVKASINRRFQVELFDVLDNSGYRIKGF